jgi:hypothetical protein
VKGESWWLKLGDFLPILRQKCQEYWDIGSYLTVDEIMISFDNRSIQKVTILVKPIPILCVTDRGDLGSFLFRTFAKRFYISARIETNLRDNFIILTAL